MYNSSSYSYTISGDSGQGESLSITRLLWVIAMEMLFDIDKPFSVIIMAIYQPYDSLELLLHPLVYSQWCTIILLPPGTSSRCNSLSSINDWAL